MNTPFISNSIYKFLFTLLGFIYIIGLFVPLMDSDSAHHADLALRMYLTGDYVNLIDQSGDYLDKPHLLFWLCAFSYKIFGVTSFAYRLPSFLFTIWGTYSTYRLGKALYNSEVGKLAALIVASSFAYMLANNDVRMEAILTSCIVFAIWQLVEFINSKRLVNVAGAAIGLALGFCTKGTIALFVPAVAAIFYIIYKKEWRLFYNWRWLVMVLLFGLLISPVVYCYYLQYNLHPEKIVRAKDHINGVKFILLKQSADRFSGEMGNDSKHDYFFFLHSFLWAFAPWSILTYIAVADRIKNFLSRKEEWLTTGVFVILLLVISFSGFKLPHYLNIAFPSSAVLVAAFILSKKNNPRWISAMLIIQGIIVFLQLLLIAVINAWAFPVKNIWVIIGMILMLAVVFYFIKSKRYETHQKTIFVSVATMAFSFFLLNSNFYPQLLKYQAGKNLALLTKGKADAADVYEKDDYSASYVFYTRSLFKKFNDSLLLTGKSIWVLTGPGADEQLKKEGYKIGKIYAAVHFRITKLSLKFLNPATRDKECSEMMLIEITGKENINSAK